MKPVSLLMPAYNAGRYVGAAIESIQAQTMADFEFVIVDDGSTDSTLAILHAAAERDPRIRVLSRPNTGIVGALNDGLSVISSEFVARMDADDLCAPKRLELQLAHLKAHPEVVAVGSCGIAIDDAGAVLGSTPLPLTHQEIEARHLRGISSIFHPAVMLRTAAVRSVGGYREGLCPCEDFDLWLRLGEVGRLENLAEPLFFWRRTLTGIVASRAAVMRTAIDRVLADAWTRRGLPGAPPRSDVRPASRADLLRQWSWMALRNGHRRTALRHALRGLLADFTSLESWRLAACVLRGR
jgi:glycosyltransferase involved in cell wall biosynthesis